LDGAPSPGDGRRRRVLLFSLLVAAGLLAVVLAARRWFPRPGMDSGPSAAQREAARSDPLRAEAFALADQVIQDFPDYPHALHARGLILNRFGNDAAAVQCWQGCLQREPRFAPAAYCLGRNAFDQGQYGQCIALMKQALEAEPGMWDALLYQGRAEMSRGNVDQAIDALQQYLRQSPRSTEGQFRLGQAFLQAERYEAASARFLAALALDPKCKHAHYGLAQVFRRLGDEERARRQLEEFEKLDTERARAGRGMRRNYDDQAAMHESIAHLHTVVGKVYAAYGEPAKAETHFRRAAELDPTQAAKSR
jgi:tetratricopeptide (TPR) repeat protein